MDIKELIRLYFERSEALQDYWTLYVVVIGGILAVSSMRHRTSWVTTLTVSILYCSFAYKNLGAIKDTTFQRMATLEQIKDVGASDKPTQALLPTMNVPTYESVRNFHVFCDVLTVVTLWVFEIRRGRYMREDAEKSKDPLAA